MKKYTHKLVASFMAVSLLLTPSVVLAQAVEDVTIGGSESTTLDVSETSTATTGVEAAGVPDTGFAPTDNKLIASSSVFIGGAVLGGLIGLGYVQLKKRKQS
jgi:hypothetical protein